MIKERISILKKLIQYSVLVAGEKLGKGGGLGKTFIMKLLYFADLEYAVRHEGETYSEVEWVFGSFGAYANEIQNLIEPAITVLETVVIPFNYAYKDLT